MRNVIEDRVFTLFCDSKKCEPSRVSKNSKRMTWQQTIDDEKEDAYEEGRAEGISVGRAEGLAQGVSQKAMETAENLLRMGIGTDDQISQAIGLPLEQILKIKENLSVKA